MHVCIRFLVSNSLSWNFQLMRLLRKCRSLNRLVFVAHSEHVPFTLLSGQFLPREESARFARLLFNALRKAPSLESLVVHVAFNSAEALELVELLPTTCMRLRQLYLECCSEGLNISSPGWRQATAVSLEQGLLSNLRCLEKFTSINNGIHAGMDFACVPESLRSIIIGSWGNTISTSQLRQIAQRCPILEELDVNLCIEEGTSDEIAQSDLDYFCSHTTR